MKKIRLSILGSTGSIGVQTLNVVSKLNSIKDQTGLELEVVSLAVNRNVVKLKEQIAKYSPNKVAVFDETKSKEISGNIEVLSGIDGLRELAKDPEVDIVVVSVSGSIGMLPTVEALKTNHKVALANKETLIAGGQVIMDLAKSKGKLVPIDSEHSAIYQCLVGEDKTKIKKLVITASGGSFRDVPYEKLKGITVKDALNHPTWSMGKKITIDSATLMNKGLEIIEAHWLFDVPYEKIQPIIHRESVIHSIVEFVDGSSKAQMSWPTMEIPIQYALLESRLPHDEKPIYDVLIEKKNLTFQKIDLQNPKFKCLKLALDAAQIGGTMPTIMNAANEVAVSAFLNEKIQYLQIPEIIERTIAYYKDKYYSSEYIQEAMKSSYDLAIKAILEHDTQSRKIASSFIG